MDFINAAHFDSDSATNAVINKPADTADNDVMFAILKATGDVDPTSVPAGWALVGKMYNAGGGLTQYLYWKLAASEGASYTWVWASANRLGGTIATYRGDFNTADVIDISSNTAYVTDNTTCRAASMVVSAANSPLIFAGGFHVSATQSFTKPTAPVDSWTEDVDVWSAGGSRYARTLCHMVWAGSGASGDIDATMSASSGVKHAFAVALNPAAWGGGRTTKNARGNPLGVSHGMNFRGQL